MNLFCNIADISQDVMLLYPHPTVVMSPYEESKLFQMYCICIFVFCICHAIHPPCKIVVKAKHKPVLMFSLAAPDAQEMCGCESVCVRLALWSKEGRLGHNTDTAHSALSCVRCQEISSEKHKSSQLTVTVPSHEVKSPFRDLP